MNIETAVGHVFSTRAHVAKALQLFGLINGITKADNESKDFLRMKSMDYDAIQKELLVDLTNYMVRHQTTEISENSLLNLARTTPSEGCMTALNTVVKEQDFPVTDDDVKKLVESTTESYLEFRLSLSLFLGVKEDELEESYKAISE